MSDITWTGLINTNWSENNNWSTSARPGVSDTVIFSSAYSVDCNLNINTTVNAISSNSYSNTLNLSSSTLAINTSAYFGSFTSGTIESSVSTIYMPNTGSVISLYPIELYNLDLYGNTTLVNYDLPGRIKNRLKVNNIFDLDSGSIYLEGITIFRDETNIVSIDGSGNLTDGLLLSGSDALLSLEGTLSCDTVYCSPFASVISARDFYDFTIRQGEFTGNDRFTFGSGDWDIQKLTVEADQRATPIIIDMSANQPTINVVNGISTNRDVGTINWYLDNTITTCASVNLNVVSDEVYISDNATINCLSVDSNSKVLCGDSVSYLPKIIVSGNDTGHWIFDGVKAKNFIAYDGVDLYFNNNIDLIDQFVVSGSGYSLSGLTDLVISANEVRLQGRNETNKLSVCATGIDFLANNQILANYIQIASSSASPVVCAAAYQSTDGGTNNNWDFRTINIVSVTPTSGTFFNNNLDVSGSNLLSATLFIDGSNVTAISQTDVLINFDVPDLSVGEYTISANFII